MRTTGNTTVGERMEHELVQPLWKRAQHGLLEGRVSEATAQQSLWDQEMHASVRSSIVTMTIIWNWLRC